jgi:hypothetical protein
MGARSGGSQATTVIVRRRINHPMDSAVWLRGTTKAQEMRMKRTTRSMLLVTLLVLTLLGQVVMSASAKAAQVAPMSTLSVPCDNRGCDGLPINPSCQASQIRPIGPINIPSDVQPGRTLFQLNMFYSTECAAGWAAIMNLSGVTLTFPAADIERIINGNINASQTGQVSSLTNGNWLSSPMLGGVNGDVLAVRGRAVDIGGGTVDFSAWYSWSVG